MIKNKKKSCYLLQQGFMIIESLVVMVVLISLMTLGSRYLIDQSDKTVHQVVALSLQQVAKAASLYVQDHVADYQQGGDLTVKTLINKGYLGLQQQETNLYGQTYDIQITALSDEKLLQIIVNTKGGRSASENAMRQIVQLVGGEGGYVSTLSPGKVMGSYGSWELSGLKVASGHLVYLKIINTQDVMVTMDTASFLCRKKVKDHPEYNTMETDLQIAQENKLFFDNGFSLSKNTLEFPNKKSDSTKIKAIFDGGEAALSLSNGKVKTIIKPGIVDVDSGSYMNKYRLSTKGLISMTAFEPILVSEEILTVPSIFFNEGLYDDDRIYKGYARKLCSMDMKGGLFLAYSNDNDGYRLFLCTRHSWGGGYFKEITLGRTLGRGD